MQQELLQKVDPVMGKVLAKELQGAFPAIALDSHSSLYTAYANDMDAKVCLAQALQGYGHPPRCAFSDCNIGEFRKYFICGSDGKGLWNAGNRADGKRGWKACRAF